MKKKRLSKLTILAVTGTICTSIFAPSVTTFASERNSIPITQNITTPSTDKTIDEIIDYINLNKEQLNKDFNSSNKQERGVISISTKVAKKITYKV